MLVLMLRGKRFIFEKNYEKPFWNKKEKLKKIILYIPYIYTIITFLLSPKNPLCSCECKISVNLFKSDINETLCESCMLDKFKVFDFNVQMLEHNEFFSQFQTFLLSFICIYLFINILFSMEFGRRGYYFE